MRLRWLAKGSARRCGFVVAGALVSSFAATGASADEPRLASEPRLLLEPTEVTRVVDAFDEGNPFDLHVSLGYRHTSKQADIYRDAALGAQGATREFSSNATVPIARSTETTNRLETRADVGLYHDVALVVRMPIILSNDRELRSLEGSGSRQQTLLAGAEGEQLFALPFDSPTRSGIEYLAVGFDLGIANQYRDRSLPSWVFGFEGRFNVSEPMHACNADPPQGEVKCADPGDVNRNGRRDDNAAIAGVSPTDVPLEGDFTGSRSPGVSRGMTGLEVHTYISKRVKYIEPYGGFRALFEFPTGHSDFRTLDLRSTLVSHPPLEGTVISGLSVIPWEVRARMQRILLDFRFEGTYRSEGQDYSELFDALGSSDALTLRLPAYERYTNNANGESVVDTNSRKVYFTGLTDVQQHLLWTLRTEVTWQAGEYVRFQAGGSYTRAQSHLLTNSQACNPDFTGNPAAAGRCHEALDDAGAQRVTGIPNSSYRTAIDAPGRRFRVAGSDSMDAWLRATVMF
jgi:hypothetical protein